MYTIEINDDEISRLLNRLSRALTDMSPVMNSIGEQLEYQTEQRFDAGVAPDGTAWAPKSLTTIDAYIRRGARVDFRPLFGPNDDGLPLRRSFYREYGPDFVEVGTNKKYAAVMQFGASKGAFGSTGKGSSIPWGNIPARPFLGVSDQDKANITDTITEWLQSTTQSKD